MRGRGSNGARGHARAGLWLWLAACHPAAETTAPVEPTTTREATTRAAEPLEPLEPAPCGPIGDRFDDHSWIPTAATTVASLQLDAPELDAALRALGEHARAPGHGLPIPLAFSLGQWSWQVPVLVATLRQAGLRPAELVFLRDDTGDHAWVWRSRCDLDETIARIETAWSLRSRRVVEGMVATPTTAGAFPYDVLMLPGERMAFVPAGRASTALARWGTPPPPPRLGAAPTPTTGRQLDELDAAAVRLVLIGRALLDPAAVATEHAPQTLRISGAGVLAPPDPAGDASLPPAP